MWCVFTDKSLEDWLSVSNPTRQETSEFLNYTFLIHTDPNDNSLSPSVYWFFPSSPQVGVQFLMSKECRVLMLRIWDTFFWSMTLMLVWYNKAWKMLIITCDALHLQQLTDLPEFIWYYLIMVLLCFIDAQLSIQSCSQGYCIIHP